MILPIDEKELKTRVELNFKRLCEGSYYGINEIFSPPDYDWSGDKEGRALLAFVSHYKMSGRKIPCMEQMMEKLESRFNPFGYLGPVYGSVIQEQQLSGHSWLLRGLCEHYEQFSDERSLRVVEGIVKNLYLDKAGRFYSYPLERSEENVGDVCGSDSEKKDGWILSSDIGCAFMSIDGLSHAYCITKDSAVKALLDEMIETYLGIDKRALKAQTHCTLTAARGMMRLYNETGEKRYLDGALDIFDLYANGGGVTATYHNLNWWGRPDTWTEPCAVVDSLMLACELYKVTKDKKYRTFAARVYHNAFATVQRPNGGAGTDSIVLRGVQDTLFMQSYEAHFCCTMRLSEGLWYVNENRELLFAECEGEVTLRDGVYRDGDIIYAEQTGVEKAFSGALARDGHTLAPIAKLYALSDEEAVALRQKIIFE